MSGKAKLAYALISVFIACLLWVYVVGVEKPTKVETIQGVVVTLNGEDELLSDYSLVVTSNKKVQIDIEVQGSIVDIAALRNLRGEITASADLSIVTTAGTHQLMYEVALPKELSDKVTVVSRSPAYISVKIEKVLTRVLEVELIDEVTIAEGYIAEQPVIEPASLVITGPEAAVAKIDRAEVVWKRQNVTDSITNELEYHLYDEFGQEVPRTEVSVDRDYVTVSMEVAQLKEIPLFVGLTPGGGAAVNDATVDIDPPTITVKGDSDVLSTLNTIQLDPVDLGEQLSRTGKYTRNIILPNNVVNLSGTTECTVTVELAGLVTRTLACENISVVGVPEGYVAELTTKRISVAIRGRTEVVEEVRPNNIRAVVSLHDANLARGTVSVEAHIYIDGHSEVGALGSYRVALVVMTQEEADAIAEAEAVAAASLVEAGIPVR